MSCLVTAIDLPSCKLLYQQRLLHQQQESTLAWNLVIAWRRSLVWNAQCDKIRALDDCKNRSDDRKNHGDVWKSWRSLQESWRCLKKYCRCLEIVAIVAIIEKIVVICSDYCKNLGKIVVNIKPHRLAFIIIIRYLISFSDWPQTTTWLCSCPEWLLTLRRYLKTKWKKQGKVLASLLLSMLVLEPVKPTVHQPVQE